MSFKSKVLATAATLTLVGGAGIGALATSANAATNSCGLGFAEACTNIYNHQFGRHFLLDVYRQGAKVGQPIILFRASNTDPAEDFTASDLVTPATATVPAHAMTVADLQAVDPIFNAATLVQYGGDPVYEFQYAPYGVDSGLCAGVASTAFQNEGVTLQPCGFTAKTVWIQANQKYDPFTGTVPLINGSNINFTHPYVLNYPQNGYPTDVPRPQLTVRQIQTYSNPSGFFATNVYNNQLWGFSFGPVR
jgi:hypothetical protein